MLLYKEEEVAFGRLLSGIKGLRELFLDSVFSIFCLGKKTGNKLNTRDS